VYVYMVEYKDINKKSLLQKGIVALIR
jgi:hypothetical protein